MNAEKNQKPFGTLSLLISSCKIEMVAQREKQGKRYTFLIVQTSSDYLFNGFSVCYP
jgi:hypothetical protein